MGSKVASNGGCVSVKAGEGEGLETPLMAIGWKGVAVGVASAGTVTRYRVVGVERDAGAEGWPPQAEIIIRSRQARLIIRERIEGCMMNTAVKQPSRGWYRFGGCGSGGFRRCTGFASGRLSLRV